MTNDERNPKAEIRSSFVKSATEDGRPNAKVEGENRVRELRIASKLSQEMLGQALGVSRQTINSIENGRYLPSLPLALAIARNFEETVEAIFIDDTEEAS